MKQTNLFGFTDATEKYNDLEKKYNRFKIGNIILVPPGSGKTAFVRNQTGEKRDWIDADDLCEEMDVDCGPNNNIQIEKLSYLRADYILEQSKLYGFNIIGSLFWDYHPNAIVVPKFADHTKNISNRPDLDYNNVMKIRKYLEYKSAHNHIPLFTTIEDAISYINAKKRN